MIRVGLLGCGVVASYGHLPAIAATEGLKLVSLFDPNLARAKEAAEKYQAPGAFDDIEAFFESGIDAVVITSPAPAHLSNVLMAARHRKPVLCEKPLAMTEGDSRQMIEAMEKAGVPLYVGFTYRFASPAREIKRLIKEGAIGEAKSLRLIYIWDCHGKCSPRTDPAQPNQRRWGRMEEGGPMFDCGVHQIDLARWWLGSEVRQITGVGAWVDTFESPDHVYLHMDHEGGCHTMVEMSYSYAMTVARPHPQFVYEIIGTDGVIRFDREQKQFTLINSHGEQELAFGHEKNFEGMYAEYEKAVRTKCDGDMPTRRDGLIVSHIARQATEQAILRRKTAAGSPSVA